MKFRAIAKLLQTSYQATFDNNLSVHKEKFIVEKIKILYPRIEDDIKKRNECSENLRKILAKSKLKKKITSDMKMKFGF